MHAEERTTNTLYHEDCSGDSGSANGESPENCSMNGNVQGRRQRPMSVMGVLDFSSDAEKEDHLPCVGFHNSNSVGVLC